MVGSCCAPAILPKVSVEGSGSMTLEMLSQTLLASQDLLRCMVSDAEEGKFVSSLPFLGSWFA